MGQHDCHANAAADKLERVDDEWWAYQRKIGNSFPLLYEVWQCVSNRPMSSGQIERDFDAASDVLTREHGNTVGSWVRGSQKNAGQVGSWVRGSPRPKTLPVTY